MAVRAKACWGGIAFGAGKLQRVNAGAVQQLRHPNLLAIGFVEHEIAVDVPDRYRAGEVRVCDLLKHVGARVINITLRIGGDE